MIWASLLSAALGLCLLVQLVMDPSLLWQQWVTLPLAEPCSREMELNVELILHEGGCAPLVPHTTALPNQPAAPGERLRLLAAGPGSGAASLGWGLAASSLWVARPGQQLPEDALISEVRSELLFQGWRSRMGSCSAERGQEVVFLLMPQRVLPHRSSGWVSTLCGLDHGPRAAEQHSCDCAVGGAGPLLHEIPVAGSHADPG